MNTTKQLFIQFLKDNNSYEEFVNNFKTSHISPFKSYFNHFTVNGSIDLIGKAFSWGATNEGYEYWKKLNEKWKKTLFDFLFPHLITILKKHNLYGCFIINTYKEGKKLKEFIETGIPYDYPYKSFKDTEVLDSTGYWKMQEEWLTIVLKIIT